MPSVIDDKTWEEVFNVFTGQRFFSICNGGRTCSFISSCQRERAAFFYRIARKTCGPRCLDKKFCLV